MLAYYTKKLTGIFARKFSYLEKRKKKKEMVNKILNIRKWLSRNTNSKSLFFLNKAGEIEESSRVR